MSFLQLISKPAERHSSNPAFLHLSRPHPARPSFKSGPDRAPTAPSLRPRTPALARTLFARGKNPSSNESPRGVDSERSSPSPLEKQEKQEKGLGSRVQFHHSFSNYLSRKPSGGGRRSNLQGRLMYFDLNEIVHKIASPIKLEPKVEGEEEPLSPPAAQVKHANLAHYQRFLREVHHERSRYHQQEAILARTEGTEGRRPRPSALWLRKAGERGDIEPWLENEEQHSPMRTHKHHSSFQPRHPVEDFEDLMS